MRAECYPVTVLPHLSPLYRDYLAMAESGPNAVVRRWYGGEPFGGAWIKTAAPRVDAVALANELERQNRSWGAGEKALENIEALRNGAAAVVTGQQVGLLGGPLLTLLKAATAIRKALIATQTSGRPHVPIFWLASEDHDLPEVNQFSLLSKHAVEMLRVELPASRAVPVGGVKPGTAIEPVLARAEELLGYAPVCRLLRECYSTEATLADSFAKFIAHVFAQHGLIVVDASSRAFHTMGASTLRAAIEHADALHEALAARGEQLATSGYHEQVLVAKGASLLFLLDADTGERQALKRTSEPAQWKAGQRTYSTTDLLAILETESERLSPNALLRSVFQDTVLPTAAYIGGPAEIAYFAQSAVLYERILGRITPILPRLSATLIEPAIAVAMAHHEVDLPQAMTPAEDLAQRLGVRKMPIEGKRKLAAVGNALDAELTALTEYMKAMDASLGQSAEVSASKMQYQMNRLRRMAATFELQREASLRKHAEAITLNLFPEGHPQERVLAGAWFLARYGDGLADLLVDVAEQECSGHKAIFL